jgi:hypothetical protein
MCLEVVVLFPRGAKRPVDPEKLPSSTALHVNARRTDDGREVLYFFGAGGCGCDFLSGSGDHRRGSKNWRLAETHIPQLVALVVAIGKKARAFSFRAEWLGIDGRSRDREETSLPTLIGDIRNNRLKDGVEYVVAG